MADEQTAKQRLAEIQERRIETAMGDLAAALFARAQQDPLAAYRLCRAAASTLNTFNMDLIKTGRVKYDDL